MCFVLACYWVSSRHDPCRVRSNLLPSKSANFGRLLRFFTCYLLRLSESSRSVDLRSAAAASRVLRLGEYVEGRSRRARQGGGADRDRTGGLRLAKPALSQLSYSPRGNEERQVGQGRVELPTSRLSGVRSNHLSYWPRIDESSALSPTETISVPQN